MFSGVIAAILLFFIFKVCIKDEEAEVDGFMAITMVAAPMIVNIFFAVGVSYFNLPDAFKHLGLLFYFLIPFYFLKFLFELRLGKSILLSLLVPIVFVGSSVLFGLLLSAVR